ncbi:MAG: Hsp20 family protein [Flavobacteriales bacterium]|nr:Hsp20 family protein [Flavobacteriales bacterium]
MRVDKEVLRMLADSGDLVNTINGGMSLAHVNKYTNVDHYLVTVKVPGVDRGSLKVELHDNHLFVFQLMHLEDGIDIPYMVASIELESNVDRHAVTANYSGKALTIVLPFNESEDSEIRISD